MNHMNSIYSYVTPLTPYLICNHYISHEIHVPSNKRFRLSYNLNRSQYSGKINPNSNQFLMWDTQNINRYKNALNWSTRLAKHDKIPTLFAGTLQIKANDLIKYKNYDDIKNNDIIQIQVNLFDFFYYEVLPFLINKNIKVIIITSQSHFPPLQISSKTDHLLNNSNIILWISQNPIYTNNIKYMAFPYGLCNDSVNEYSNFIHSHTMNTDNTYKNIKLLNQRSTPHSHFSENHIRKQFDIFGKNSGEPLKYNDFLTNILNSEFVISTTGDRDDCYRHYECIGLNAIPVSNINNIYKDIFEDNMIYSNAEEMVEMVNNNIVQYNYKKPNIEILKISYWVNKMYQKLNLINQPTQS